MKAEKTEAPAVVEVVPSISAADVAPETAPLAAATATPQASAPIDDSAIRDLAKRRLATRRSLLVQAFDYLLIIACTVTLANFAYGDAMVLAFFFCAFWGLRLLYRIVKFMEPSFKGGIGDYLRKRREQQLESEYDRLKKMGAEYVTHELSR